MVTQIIESRFQWFTILSRIDSINSFLINDNYRCRHCFTLQLVSFRWEPMLSNAKPIVKYQLRNNTYFRLIIFLRLKPLAITDPKIYLLILLPTSKPIHRDLHSDEPAYLIYPQYYWKSSEKERLVKRLSFGFTEAGIYRQRDKAAYWDGRNADRELFSSKN